MKRLHVNLSVKDVTESVRFYSTLFGSTPTVLKPDYAKWMLEDPRVNFSIASGSDRHGVEHLGIQAEDRKELDDLRRRIAQANGTVRDEGETTCCYAQSDKTWFTDAQGVSWEAFYTHGESETFHAESAKTAGREEACCEPGCCETATP